MSDLTVAFLNCEHFYEPGQVVGTGPQTQTDFDTKRTGIAGLLRRVSRDTPLDIIGLCEIGTDAVATDLGNVIDRNAYETYFVPASKGCRFPQGLAILYRADRLRLQKEKTGLIQDGFPHRPYWSAGLFQALDGKKGGFWFVVNHWKSNYPPNFRDNEAKRVTAAKLFADFYLDSAQSRSDPVVSVGDFNCEPWERPFRASGTAFRAVRERNLVTRGGNRSLYLYNLMWRWLGEPDDLETSENSGYVVSRPRGTWNADSKKRDMDWRVFDHFMVSKSLLRRDGVIHLQEKTLCSVFPTDGCTDHGAISATLTM